MTPARRLAENGNRVRHPFIGVPFLFPPVCSRAVRLPFSMR